MCRFTWSALFEIIRGRVYIIVQENWNMLKLSHTINWELEKQSWQWTFVSVWMPKFARSVIEDFPIKWKRQMDGSVFLAATKQLLEHFCAFVRPSLCLLHHFHNVPVIVSSWNFQELLPTTKVMSTQSQRLKVKVTEVKTQYSRFRTVTPVWIWIWWWNDAQSLMLLKRGSLYFFKVICQVGIHRWLWNDAQSLV